MTVEELIEKLAKFPPEMEVVVNGYEGGYTKLTEIEELKITNEPVNNAWYFGSYDEDDNGVAVILIPRY